MYRKRLINRKVRGMPYGYDGEGKKKIYVAISYIT